MPGKISIVVPVYNVEQYLDKCIQSILDQTYPNLEVILVDDGSTDRCSQICDEWSLRDSRIRVIHQKNAGVAVARNVGIRAAGGEYLYFVDSDDWIATDLCEKVMQVFAVCDVDIVIFNCDQILENGKSLGGTETLREGLLSREDALKNLLQGNINGYLWNKIYRKKVFDNIWLPERTAFEDMAISYKLLINADQIYCLDEKLYYYYQRAGSATSVLNSRKLCELFLSRWESYEYLKPLYPNIAEIVFPRVAQCALRLYDRSLWEKVDEEIYGISQEFLRENKTRILREERAAHIWVYYTLPGVYKMLRLGKHCIGNIVRALRLRYAR